MGLRLKDICQVRMGYPFRSKLERSDADNCVNIIQMKDISEAGCLNTEDLMRVELQNIQDRYKLRKDDVIFKSRGHLNNAAHVTYDIHNAVAASPLMTLTVIAQNVLPTYVAWYINQPSAQRQIESMARGTSVRMIGKADLEELETPVPSIETQEKIIVVAELYQREQRLLNEISIRRKKLVQVSLNMIANERQGKSI